MIACNAGSHPYDSEKTWLSRFFGDLRARNDGTLRGRLIKFDQSEFGASAGNSMDSTGYAFVPRNCSGTGRETMSDREDGCGFVVAFHGCLQGQAQIGNRFVTESGIDEWADTNRIIVLYPYAIETPPTNPNGCWDKMVQRMTGAP